MSKETDIKLLGIIEDEIFKDMFELHSYAGIAFLEDNTEEMSLWKGQYMALKRARQRVMDRSIAIQTSSEIKNPNKRRPIKLGRTSSDNRTSKSDK